MNALAKIVSDPSVEAEKLPRVPHNLEAEQALIGAILVDNRAFERVSEIIAPLDFFDALHGLIFETISKIITDGRTATPISLAPFFENAEPISDGRTVVQYLGTLARNATTVSGARDYALTVRELADRRSLIIIGEDLAASAYRPESDNTPAGLVEDAEGKLFGVAEREATKGAATVSFAEASKKSLDRILAAYKRGGAIQGLSTGFVDLDKKLGGLQRSDLIILAGRPSMGKTALATNIAWNVARGKWVDDDGVERISPVGFFSLEMSDQQLAARLLSSETEISGESLNRGLLRPDQVEAVIRKQAEISSTPLHIDDRGGITIAQLVSRARRMKRRHGIELLVIDYLQLLSGSKKERVQELTQITNGLKALAKELNIPVIALSQLSRASEKREDKRPQLSDLRESGSIEQDADIVVFVYREEYYIEREKPADTDLTATSEWIAKMAAAKGKAEAVIGKHRHGPVGIVPMSFNGDLTKFSDLADEARLPERFA
ncbi:replicative DNA helicase [Hyphomicrobium sp. DY-1]|uniref:replicative DNA helicase n=1 Tax=Hyphomicrobium sp. DY-1 TaxID=3075650 RepID=UPI0039C0994F